MRRDRTRVLGACLTIAACSLALGTISDPPDSKVNAVTGSIETVDAPWAGTNFHVRHVITPGGGQPLHVTTLTSNALDDLGPRLAVDPSSGDSWVAWWRDDATDKVLVRKRSNATGSWSDEATLSSSSESSRHPSLAFDGARSWVAYEFDAPGGGISLGVKPIDDDPTPFVTRTVVGTTSYGAAVDVRIQAESHHLWVSWVDGATNVGWSRFDVPTSMWSTAAFEPYVSDTVEAARGRIRLTVLGH